jgi:hypothetical protein
MRRRDYLPIDKHQEFKVYHDLYDRYRLESHILNGGNKRIGPRSILLWDKPSVVSEIQIYEGVQDDKHKGEYIDPRTNDWVYSKIHAAKLKVKEIERKFATYRKEQVNRGFRDSEVWPKELLELRLQAEARLDVYTEEVNELHKKLAAFEDQVEIESNRLMLHMGPTAGISRVGWDGILAEIDYQKTGYLNGVLCIIEKGSPYYGLSVIDYREKVAAPWLAAFRQIDQWAKNRFKRAEHYNNRSLDDAALEKLWAVEKQKRIDAHPEWKELFKLRLPGKPPMPELPKDCVNQAKKNKNETEFSGVGL